MSNHLIIGLGGTGGKVIRNIRKAIYRDWRPSSIKSEPSSSKTTGDKVAEATPKGLKLDYLYVDSSREHMNFEDPEWKVLGENLQLDPAGQCHLKGADLKTRLDDIHSYPSLAPWIGSPQDWRSILNLGTGGAEILGGQKRRLGRLLFASNASDFMGRVNQKANQLKSGSATTDIMFHVVCGLAGGTGSGCLIDAISLIRNEYRDSKQYPIILYVLLPDEFPQQGWNTGNYHANGYAALMELNALGVGQYLPYNIMGGGERFKELSAPFKICYLITNENSNGAPFEVNKQVPELMAEMLYQKIVAGYQGVSRQLGRIVEWENMEVSHEGKGRNGGPERCRLFASFGIKKISYPEEEIRDYIGYSLSAQTLTQMLYNHWANGYLNEAVDLPVEGFVADAATQKSFNLDRDVFFLERQFSSDEQEKDQKAWKTYDADWKGFIERLAADVVEEEGNWLESLKRRCEDREKRGFRDGRGAVDYFEWKKDRIPEYARLIANGIEREFGTALISGERSLTEIETLLRSICVLLDKKKDEWAKQSDEAAASAARERVGWTENLQRFEDLGPLARKFPGNKLRIFEAGKAGMINYYAFSTRAAAWDFANSLLRKVKEELMKTTDHVVTTVAAFKNAVRYCDEHAGEHRPEEENLQSNEVVMRLFNGDEVTKYVAALIGNRDFQDKQARQARENMVEKLMAGRNGLRALPTAKDNGSLLDILAQSSHSTLTAFDASADEGTGNFGRLLSVSIIDKLRERYSGNTDLMKKEIRDYMSKAGYLLKINQAEHGKQGPGTDFSGQNKKTNLIVMMPDADSEDEFVKELRQAFEKSVADPNAVQFVDTKDSRRHEITILSFVQLFPLRYVEVMEKLREKYDTRIKDGNSKQRILELHTEGSAESFPPLYVPPVRDIAGPTLLLALACGSVRPKSSGSEAGTFRDMLVSLDGDDIPQIDLGAGFEGALQKCSSRDVLDAINSANADRVKKFIGDSIRIDAMPNMLKEIARELGRGNDDDLRTYMGYVASAGAEFEGHLHAKNQSN